MTEDFYGNALPTEAGSYFPTDRAARVQMDTWYSISGVITDLFDTCVEGRGLPGWASVAGNIIVGFWPRSSLANQRYGLDAAAALGISNSSIAASYVTERKREERGKNSFQSL